MKSSFIIPSLNRQGDLELFLESVKANSQLPDEIIIIEQGDIQKTQKVISQFNKTLHIKILPQQEKSSARARNLGIKHATGEYLFLNDDDVILEKNYIEYALSYLNDNSHVIGITGQDTLHASQPNYIGKFIGSLFCLSTLGESGKVLRSGHNTNFSSSSKVQNVQSIPGFSMVIRKKSLGNVLFNNNFIRWSFGEDVMFSYQLYKEYGEGSLIYLPQLQLEHHFSKESRISQTSLIKMKIIYRYIFWKQEVYQGNFINLICYLWSQKGLVLLDIFYKKSGKNIFTMIQTYVYLLRNYKKIDTNNIDYNNYINES